MKKVLLLYNIDSPTYRKAVEDFCSKKEITLRYVEAEEYDVPLGFVAYGSEEDRAQYLRTERGEEFRDPLMIFAGFPGGSLFEFLKDLKTAGIGTTDLKAVMTEHNAVWTSVALCEELRKEHEYMKEMREKALKEKENKNKS